VDCSLDGAARHAAATTTIAADRQAGANSASLRRGRTLPNSGRRGSKRAHAGLKLEISARWAFRAVLVAGYLAMLGANLPGHLSYDSVAQLYEGHFHVRETWGPALYAGLLGFFDGIVPGTSLYVVANGPAAVRQAWPRSAT